MSDRAKPSTTQISALQPNCYASIDEREIKLVSPHFEYQLKYDEGLRSEAWHNRITGHSLKYSKGVDIEVDIDHSKQRINIIGWRAICSQQAPSHPDEEIGLRQGFAAYSFDDSKWKGRITPVPFRLNEPYSVQQDQHYHWARTHLFLPEEAQGESVTLTLGGIGLFRFTYMRVFVNGLEIGVHEQNQRWNEPAHIELAPHHPAYAELRFGQDNMIALQLTGLTTRSDELKQIDPKKTKNLPYKNWWPAQFEQYVTINKRVEQVNFSVQSVRAIEEGEQATVVIDLLASQQSLSAQITYHWCHNQATLHKQMTLCNDSHEPIMLLHVRQGQYAIDQAVTSGEQGFPVYIHGQYFMALAHPSGWAIGQDQCVTLRQYPGQKLLSKQKFTCMESVFGVAPQSKAREAFLAHITSRMRRVVRNHQRPYAIFEPFGARKIEPTEGPPPFILYETEDFLLDNLDKLAAMEKKYPNHFDFYCLQFWVNRKGDFTTADPDDFPHDLASVNEKVQSLKMKLGLWIDSSWNEWSIGQNPVAKPSLQFVLDYGTEDYVGFCRASEPIHSLYTNGFLHHIRNNNIGLLKFDNLFAICYNPHHVHLPGIYSTEAIQSKVIQFLNRMDQENPEVFLMLYWGYRSPWWLLHGDTLFEPGLHLEASHPGPIPTLYVRDSVIVGLDQAHWWCQDVPNLGKDSLGVWLSDWPWNSSVGKERWQEAFIMDMFRGGLLAQPWGNEDWLTDEEGAQLAHFTELLRSHAECFRNARLWSGHPWKYEAYSYVAAGRERSFIVYFNCTWEDATFTFTIQDLLSASQASEYAIYRHYPQPAQYIHDANRPYFHINDRLDISLRPFELVFIEIVPKDELSRLEGQVKRIEFPRPFAQRSSWLAVAVNELPLQHAAPLPCEKIYAYQLEQAQKSSTSEMKPLDPKRNGQVKLHVPAIPTEATLVVTCQLQLGQDAYMTVDIGNYFACELLIDGQPARYEPVVRNWSLPCSWQAWRIRIQPAKHQQEVTLHVTWMSPSEAKYDFSAYLIPDPS
jgi:hypothetical protein